jgi:hypothetical protein
MAEPVMAVHPCPAKPEMDDLRESVRQSPWVASPFRTLLIILRMKNGGHICLNAVADEGARMKTRRLMAPRFTKH